MVTLDNLTVSYRQHPALHHISGRFAPGSLTAVVGPNGAGKSTLLKSIVGLLPSAGGDLSVGAPRERIAYLPQSSEIDRGFPINVADCVLLGAWCVTRAWGSVTAAMLERVAQALHDVGLDGFERRPIGSLSSGQLQRVMFARLLVQDADLILLDEPFTGVDVKTEEAIVTLLRELRDEGRLILVSTHNLGSVPEFCDQVVLINRTVLAYGPTAQVFTAENLTQAFGGALRHFDLAQSTVNDHDGRQVTVLTDDERPLVLGRKGHLEYLDRAGREKLISDREEEQKGKQ